MNDRAALDGAADAVVSCGSLTFWFGVADSFDWPLLGAFDSTVASISRSMSAKDFMPLNVLGGAAVEEVLTAANNAAASIVVVVDVFDCDETVPLDVDDDDGCNN
mmetsp:Transcript_6466/g.11235  ORF Transcript_6466/g.11235 Transcript_6466/m.11235 type:complete len:105 (+) Transcript_6466:323-637(+)